MTVMMIEWRLRGKVHGLRDWEGLFDRCGIEGPPIYILLIGLYLDVDSSRENKVGRHSSAARCQHGPRQRNEGSDNLKRARSVRLRFTDPNIYYQTYNNYDEVNFYR